MVDYIDCASAPISKQDIYPKDFTLAKISQAAIPPISKTCIQSISDIVCLYFESQEVVKMTSSADVFI